MVIWSVVVKWNCINSTVKIKWRVQILKFKKIDEGVSYNGNSFNVDFFHNHDSDIIEICAPFICQTKFDDLTYFFGYEFKPGVPSTIRTKFLHWIKGIDNQNIPDNSDIENLVALPIATLNQIVNLSTFSCMLYPRSNRSELTRTIQRSVANILPRMNIESFELVKNVPSNVEFDWKRFNLDYEGTIGDHRYQQIEDYVKNILLPKIHELSYFSIAENVKYKYRGYIANYLQFASDEDKELFQSLNGGNILIIDDINTSGSTLREILRIVRVLAPDSKIFIFTLIGNHREK